VETRYALSPHGENIMEDLKNRLMKLELLYMEQEDTVQTLSRIVHQQEGKIEHLKQRLLQITEKLDSIEDMGSATEEPPPPHY
jgi:SlyX protein